MAYNVGEVEVSVLPNASTFNDKLAAQVNPQADRLGKQIGDTLAQQIAQGIRKGLGDFPSDNPAKDPAKRKGDEAAGAFGDAFKARLKAAMADLPDIKVNADSSDVDRALAAVRADMASLGDARIGIDLSDAEALAKLDELKARLAEIGASSDSPRVKVDTAAAIADLARFQAEMDKINGETATAKVKVDDGGSSGGITSLTGALAMVAPAIVPIGAAALAGGAALGTMAAAGVGAAGVLAIAFSGVSKAVTLLHQQETQQAAADVAAGNSAAQRAQAIVSAQRQIESAQMSLGDAQRNAAQQQITDAQAVQSAQTALADARRNADNQQISDAQAVQSAQQSLARANDQVTIAQKALTDAQEAGRRELESFANNAADASLAQQQAAISLEEAQAAAAKTMASSTATDLQKRQASLDVAKAQQSLTEANQRVTESARDNTKAQTAGVSGSQAVLSAQKQVTTAQDAQQKAAQGLADAQRKAANDQITSQESIAKAAQALSNAQQRAATDQITSHESIVRAQQGVAAAADAMAAAQRQSAGTTNAALSATNDAIAKLDPTTRAFAEYLRGTWKPIWDQVQGAAAKGLLPGVQAGMDALIPVMPGITTLVGNLASTMGDLFQQGSAALAGPFWQHFISDIGTVAGPLLSDLAHALGNVAHGFAGIIDAFLPMDLQIGQGLADLTGKFAAWGEGLARSQGFKDFVAYVHDQWPVIKDVIENVSTAIGHIIQAGGLLGGPTLQILKVLTGVLAGLPVGVVAALVTAFEGFKIAQTVGGWIGAASKAFQSIHDIVDKLPAKLATAKEGLDKFAAPAAGAALAITAVVTAFEASNGQIDAWAQALAQGGQTAATATQQLSDAHSRSIADAHSLGDAWGIVKGAFADGAAQIEGYSSAQDKASQEAQKLRDQMTPMARAQQDVNTATDDLSKVMADPNHTWAQAQTASDNLKAAQYNLAQQQDAVKVSTQNANVALEQLISTQQTQASASLGLDAAILNTQNQIDNYKAHLNDTTISARDHKIAENQVEQSMLNVVEAAKKKADSDTAGQTPAQQAQAEVAAQRDALDKLVGQLGYVPPALKGMYDQLNGPQATALANAQTQTDNYKDAVKRLGDATNGLPYQHGIAVTADTQQARDAITALTTDYHKYSINVGIGGVFSSAAAADGGVLPGWSPGKDIHTFTSPTGGSLALSGGEAVMRPEFTAAVGTGWVNSMNAAARSGGTSGVRSAMAFADGGVIPTWNPWSMVAKVGIDPTSLAAARAELAAQFASGPAIATGQGGTTWPQLDAIRRQLFPGSVLTSAYRAGANDYHGLGEAIDIGVPGNLQSGLMPIAATLARLYPGSTELIHNPNGSIKDGHPVPPGFWGPATWAQHANHVHWAMSPSAVAATHGFSGGGGNPSMRALGQQIAANMGWASQFAAIDAVFTRESGWNPNAQNPTSTAYGIPQFLNSTWAAYGGKTSSPGQQITDGIQYMVDRYGSPAGALAHERSAGWYDQGGLVPPGYHMLYNGTGGNEVIAPERTFQQVVNKMHADAPGSGNGGPMQVTLQLDGHAVTDLLDGRVVHFADVVTSRGSYNG